MVALMQQHETEAQTLTTAEGGKEVTHCGLSERTSNSSTLSTSLVTVNCYFLTDKSFKLEQICEAYFIFLPVTSFCNC